MIENFVCCPVCFLVDTYFFSFPSACSQWKSSNYGVKWVNVQRKMVKILKSVFVLRVLSRKNPEETQGVIFRTVLLYLISGLVMHILNRLCVRIIQILRYLNRKLKFRQLHCVFLFSLNLETLGTKCSY